MTLPPSPPSPPAYYGGYASWETRRFQRICSPCRYTVGRKTPHRNLVQAAPEALHTPLYQPAGGACVRGMPAAVRSAQAAVRANQAARQRSSATPPPQGSSGRKSPANRQSPQIGQSVKEKAAEAPKVEEEEAPKSCPRRTCRWVLDFLDQTWLQTLQYIIFLFAFQSIDH